MLQWSPQQHSKRSCNNSLLQSLTSASPESSSPPLQPVTDTSPLWSGMSSLPLKLFSHQTSVQTTLEGYSVSLCPSCYALSASAASLMPRGLRAGLNHNYALPHSLQLCAERRGLWEALFKKKLLAQDALCSHRRQHHLHKSLILSAYGAPSPPSSITCLFQFPEKTFVINNH